MKYYADGKHIRAYAAITGASLHKALSGALATVADTVIFTVGAMVKTAVPTATGPQLTGGHAAITGESDGGETIRLSRDEARRLMTFASGAGRKRVYLFTTSLTRTESNGVWPSALEATYGEDKLCRIRLRDVEGSEQRMSEDLARKVLVGEGLDRKQAMREGGDPHAARREAAKRLQADLSQPAMVEAIAEGIDTDPAERDRQFRARLAERGLTPPVETRIESLMDSGVKSGRTPEDSARRKAAREAPLAEIALDAVDAVLEAESVLRPANPCNCEHTSHFNDQYGPQTGHDHLAVEAGKNAALYVGPVCDKCAATCMADYLILGVASTEDMPDVPPGAVRDAFSIAITVKSADGGRTVKPHERVWHGTTPDEAASLAARWVVGNAWGNGPYMLAGMETGDPESLSLYRLAIHRAAVADGDTDALEECDARCGHVRPTVRVKDWWRIAHSTGASSDAAEEAAHADVPNRTEVTRNALEYAKTARDMGDTRFLVGERSDIRVTMPDREGNGVGRRWGRVINGTPYAFTAVVMPSGERRYYAEKYNGYGDDGTVDGRMSGMRFGCAWSPAHDITFPAGTVPVAEDNPLDPRTARVAADSMGDVFTPRGNAVVIGELSADGCVAVVGGRLESDRVYAVHELSYSLSEMAYAIRNRRAEYPFLYAAAQIATRFEPSNFQHEGRTVSVRIVDDAESRPDEAECYSEEQIAAWRRDDWRYIGLILTIRDSDDREIGQASLFRIEDFSGIGHYAEIIESLYGQAKPSTHAFRVRADDEILTVEARDISHAFKVARAMRPDAVVVTDTMGSAKAKRVGREIERTRPATVDTIAVDMGTVSLAMDMLAAYGARMRDEATRNRAEAAKQRVKASDGRPEDLAHWCRTAGDAYERDARQADRVAGNAELAYRRLAEAHEGKGESMTSDPMEIYGTLRVGTFVVTLSNVDKPDWATHGVVVSLPGPNSDYYDHPLVKWSDGIKRHVPRTWLAWHESTPDRWGSVDAGMVDRYANDETGDQVLHVITPAGESVIVYAYAGGHSPQAFVYPNDEKASEAFQAAAKRMGRED